MDILAFVSAIIKKLLQEFVSQYAPQVCIYLMDIVYLNASKINTIMEDNAYVIQAIINLIIIQIV